MTERTVFVVDDDRALRESLTWLIESVGLSVESYVSAGEFLDAYDSSKGGCLVLDVRMPGMGGLELQQELGRRDIDIPIIILTGHAEVSTAVRALQSGASDFLEKPFSDERLLDSIWKALRLDEQRRCSRADAAEIAARFGRLTAREREVMDRIVAGGSNKVVAAELHLSPRTVEVHRARVMEKLEVTSLPDLARLAMRFEDREEPS